MVKEHLNGDGSDKNIIMMWQSKHKNLHFVSNEQNDWQLLDMHK